MSVTPAAASNPGGPERGGRRFPRSHRLKHRRLVRSLFDRKSSDLHHTASGSVRAVFRFLAATEARNVDAPVQTGFFVGRRVAGAVIRNRVRRRMREAYRMRHSELVRAMRSQVTEVLVLGLVFRGRGDETWEGISRDVRIAVDAVRRQISARYTGVGHPSIDSR